MEPVCSLCKSPIPNSRRRRKLHGSSCATPRATLERFVIANLGLTLECVVETCNPHAYLCHICVKQLDSVPALEEKLASAQKELESLKKELNSKVSNLRTKQFVYGSKRPSMPPHSKDEAPSNTPRTTSQGSSTSTESHSPSEMPLPIDLYSCLLL